MEFDRWIAKCGSSWAYRLFKRHHTILNSLYWSYVPVASYSEYTYRHNKKNATTQQIFHATGQDAHRIVESPEKWNMNFKEFDNWIRLNALVALLSYFEVYLSSVVSLAIESDPGLIFNTKNKVVDGIKILKTNTTGDYSFFHISEDITKGEWPGRISAYKKTFGRVPQILTDSVKDLEKMRNMRNNIAHAFGRDIKKAQSRSLTDILETERLSVVRLKRYMEVIEGIAREIDHHLVPEFIGDYEAIYYYHQIRNSKPGGWSGVELRKEFNKIQINGTCSEQYCVELMNYYNEI